MLIPAHATQQNKHRHVLRLADRACRPGRRWLGVPSLAPLFAASRSTDRAGSDSGTLCSLAAFMRAAGTVQRACVLSISDQRAPITSPVRAAVRMANRKCQRGDAVLPGKRGHERSNLAPGQRGMMHNGPHL